MTIVIKATFISLLGGIKRKFGGLSSETKRNILQSKGYLAPLPLGGGRGLGFIKTV